LAQVSKVIVKHGTLLYRITLGLHSSSDGQSLWRDTTHNIIYTVCTFLSNHIPAVHNVNYETRIFSIYVQQANNQYKNNIKNM